MKALRDLRRFILAKSNTEDQHEIREYVLENVYELARDFHVPEDSIITAIDCVKDDSSLACKLLETIRRTESLQRDKHRDARATAAQASADALASMVRWQDGKGHLDIVSLLASSLTKRNDLMVFTCDDFTVGVYMAPLFDLAKLKRRDLTAFVDAEGLHIRWRTGGLNLRSQTDAKADRIILPLPAQRGALAA